MRTLFDIINELDPTELWDSINLEADYLSPEQVEAFFTVYQRVMTTRPEIEPAVFQGVEIIKPGEDTILLTSNNLYEKPRRVQIDGTCIDILLGLYIPSCYYDICRSSVISEMFRCLVADELEKPVYRIEKLKREIIESLSYDQEYDIKVFKNKKKLNALMRQRSWEEQLDSIRYECLEQLPEIGKHYSWQSLFNNIVLTPELCNDLLPTNPPSLTRLMEVKKEIEREIDANNKELSRSFGDEISDEFRDLFNQYKVKACKKKLIVGYNNISWMNIPLIYTIDEKGSRAEIESSILSNPLQYEIIVQNHEFLYNDSELCAYILMYLAYPLRMHREIRSSQLQVILNLLLRGIDG